MGYRNGDLIVLILARLTGMRVARAYRIFGLARRGAAWVASVRSAIESVAAGRHKWLCSKWIGGGQMAKKTKRALLVIALGAALGVGLVEVTGTSDRPASKVAAAPDDPSQAPRGACREYIKRVLHDPDSAEWEPGIAWRRQRLAEGHCYSHVDEWRKAPLELVPMEKVSTVKAFIDLFPTRRVLADDIGVEVDRVNGWAKTGSIPARFHWPVCRAANDRGIPVSAEDLDRMLAWAEDAE